MAIKKNGLSLDKPFRLINLSQYKPISLPQGLGQTFCQTTLSNSNGKMIYSAYTAPNFAICEITYSRLCNLLGLSCVNAQYGINMPNQRELPFVSISSYNPNWLPYAEWLNKDHLPTSRLTNHDDIAQHKTLLALQGVFWADNGFGYIMPRHRFVKANNGFAFLSLGLNVESDTAIKSPSIHQIFDDTEQEPEGRIIAHRLAQISDNDLLKCIAIPNWEERSRAYDYLADRLINLKKTAILFKEALDET